MRTFILLFCTTVFSFSPSDIFSQNVKITIDEDKVVTIDEIFDLLRQQTDYTFIYQEDIFKNVPKVNLEKGTIRANKLLKEAFSSGKYNVKLTENNKIIVTEVKPIEEEAEQQFTVKGVVADSNGQPLPGANIIEKGTANGAQTDFDGKFSLTVSDDAILVVSYLGYRTKEVSVNNQNSINIILEEDAASLDEIIIVGFGTQSSRKVTAAISQVSAEELGVQDRPITNLQSALVGSLPGLRGFNSSGSPGSAPTFAIRGASSLNGTDVLVIIDDFEGSLSDINPQDIETATVLKDAAAVAVYGARGANGVLLITTKKTKKDQKMTVAYNFSGSVQSRGNLPSLLTASELIGFENFAVTGDPTGGGNPSAPYSQTAIDLANSGFYPETQWADELYKSIAAQQSHNITLRGGTDKIGFMMNAGHLSQEGLVIGNDNFKRLNLRLKIDADVTDWLSVGTNTVITNSVTNSTPSTGGNDLLGSPFFPVRTVDGLYVDKGSPGEANPIALAESGSFAKNINDALNVQLYAKISPLKGLSLEQRVSFLKRNRNTRDFDNVYDHVALNFEDPDSYTNPDSPNRVYSIGQADSRRLILTSQTDYTVTALTRLNYDVSFGDHNIGVLLGFQSIQGKSEGFRAGRLGFLLDDPLDLTLGQGLLSVPDFDPDTNLTDPLGNYSFQGGNATTLSYFGRLNYDYKGRYIAELAFRRDGSSNFLDTNQWGFFPSASVAWNIGEEPFMAKADFIDRLKLRSSYGLTGDDSGVGSRVIQLANINQTAYPFGGVIQPGISIGDIASRDLQWETAKIFNVGLDFSLWNGKFQLTTEYFVNNRVDILDEVVTPREFGFGNVPANLYAVKSWGWEFDFTHKNNIGNDFSYWFNGNISSYDNEITDLDGLETINLAVGQSINDRLGYQTDGFFDSQTELDAYVDTGGNPIDQSGVGGAFIGGYKYIDQLTVDTNNDGIPDTADGVINGDDRIILDRNSATNLNVGFNLGFAYKNLSLSARFYGALDRQQWWNGADAHEPFLNGTNAFTYQLNYWSEDNPNAIFPVPDGNGIQGYNSDVSHLIFDNEFIKLQNVTLTYDFSDFLLKKMNYVKGINLSLSVENIGVVWTNSPIREFGWDPELGAGTVDYPLPVTTSLSLNLTF